MNCFADTFYFLALLNRRDAYHAAAVSAAKGSTRKLLTTTWVLTEVADALCASATRGTAARLIRALRNDPRMTIVETSERLFTAGLALYEQRLERNWSPTDCISFVVMRELNVKVALTGDHHFEQAGFVPLLQSNPE